MLYEAISILTRDLLLRLLQEWAWHTFSMKWGNFCPWPKISLAILKMNRNCLHWLRMPLMFLHPFHFPNFPFSSVLFNAQNNLLTFWRAFFNAGKKILIWNGNFSSITYDYKVFHIQELKLLNSPFISKWTHCTCHYNNMKNCHFR